MTRSKLLDDLKKFIADAVKDFQLPTSLQKGDTTIEVRAPEVHKMRLPNARDYKKVAPYILIQFTTGTDKQTHGKQSDSNAMIRLIFCVYCDNEEEGAMHLLNVMDAVRIRLLKRVVVGEQFKLDTDAGLDSVVYTDNTAPYYAGEMIGTFLLPPIEREVSYEY